ncbi:probable G-protein coupled receptor 139 [Heterodontus francisci]|uniref:probable G-protein coupled receptor 139 n=1 Tax=Heterodontus francisci TaxID=7792 RepID=UPI00355C0B19
MDQPTIVQIKNIYYPILAAFGVPANLVTIVILSRGNCGLSKCISVYMVAMATADLLVMLVNVMVISIFTHHFPFIYLLLSYTVVCKLLNYMVCIFLHISVWFTILFTFDRFVAICCGKLKTKYCRVRTANAIITIFTGLVCLENIPFWFAFEAEQQLNNVSWGCRVKLDFTISPIGVAFYWLQSILTPWLPFALTLLFNCLTIRHILLASRARKALRGHSPENQSDPEMQSRRKSIILLFAVSGSFLLLWLTAAVSFLATKITNASHYRGDYTAPAYIATETGYMLMYLSSSTNTCIYAATQTKFRNELKKVLQSPWILIRTLVKWMKDQTRISASVNSAASQLTT